MQNKSHNGSGRPLIFGQHKDMRSFVFNNTPQTESVSLAAFPQVTILPPPATTQNFLQTAPAPLANRQHGSLFDKYFTSHLPLSHCDPRDITVLHKNVVMHEEQLSPAMTQQINRAEQKQKMSNTGTGWQRSPPRHDPLLMTAPQPTREYTQNEIMFNYQEIGQAKKQKRTQYLSEIERRIAQAESEIKDIESIQAEERSHIEEIVSFNERVGQQLGSDAKAGMVKQILGYAGQLGTEDEEQARPAPHIHAQMQSHAINEVLDEHYKLNEDVLELASAARSKSKGKTGQGWNASNTATGFNKTLKKEISSRPMSATMTGSGKKNPPKPKKR